MANFHPKKSFISKTRLRLQNRLDGGNCIRISYRPPPLIPLWYWLSALQVGVLAISTTPLTVISLLLYLISIFLFYLVFTWWRKIPFIDRRISPRRVDFQSGSTSLPIRRRSPPIWLFASRHFHSHHFWLVVELSIGDLWKWSDREQLTVNLENLE